MNYYDHRGWIWLAKHWCALPFLLWLTMAVRANGQEQTISQMVHTSWTGSDGAPQAIQALAQTPDGMLWIGGSGGLFNFDGLKFAAFSPKAGSPPLPASSTRFLFVSREGDLWFFPSHGPPCRIHQGEVHIYDRVQGEGLFQLGPAQQDSRGTLWAILNQKHLVRLGIDGAWHQEADPIEETGHVSQLFIDSSDTQWVIDNDALYRRPKRQTAFTATRVHVYGPAKIAESRDQTLWVMGQGPGPSRAPNLQHVDPMGRKLFTPNVYGQINDILIAQDGSLWISKNNAELQRFTAQAIATDHSEVAANTPDLYMPRIGLSDLRLQALLSDADGNTWVGGMGGLDRFEHANLVSVIADSKVGMWHSCVDSRGQVWVANRSGQLFVVRDGHPIQIHGGNRIENLFCGKEGRVYLIDDSGISAVLNKTLWHLPLLPGGSGYGDHYEFVGLIDEPNGDLIASVSGATEHGLWRYRNRKWSRFLPELALPEVCGMLRDAQGRLHLAFTQDLGMIFREKAGSFESLPVAIRPLGFAQTSYGILAYGVKGIAIDKENGFQTLSFLHPDQAKMITGVVESRNGDLWINGAHGIARIAATEVLAAMADLAHSASSFNLQEGDFVGPDIGALLRQSAHIDPRGRLWFSMLNGVVSVDPDHLVASRRPPLLSIRSVTADGHPSSANGTFPPDAAYLNVQYFGIDLTRPRDVVYRYRLEGLDATWQDVGSRTEAVYTHLRPGRYTFEVMASSGNDLWTAPVCSASFTILPHFYERRWFVALGIAATLVLLWLAYMRRLRFATRVIRMRAEERADERIRIARELHDTLLQGVQGLLLTFHVAAGKVPPDHESKQALEKALTTADRIILEGRNRVSRLRSEHLADSELKPSIERFAADANSNPEVDFTVERQGLTNTLAAPVVDEIFCIAREALTNAFRHAAPSRIVVELDYEKRHFSFRCHDNGHGFDVGTFLADETNGHWGLRGMAERAARIGAKFTCVSSREKGTEVEVVVPARRAYARTNGFTLFLNLLP